MNFTVENRNGFAIIKTNRNSIESKISTELKSKVSVVAQPAIEALLIDLSSVNIIDSTGLGALLLAHRQLKEHSKPVVLVGIQGSTKKLLKMTQVENIFVYHQTIDEALTNITNKNLFEREMNMNE